ncbi:hypothetical protein [Bacillus solimangrovi]|uniref:Flagellar protein FliT n=1 Tax=Bacillus solimangrovi TaxID=1305675 RepID=A0A1E5LDV7_9BACI|nr:hypothetical protein [Bacillus solimangrovi]OEH92209.1 hypothetical protein BFG57_02760 [Bacillus solimangrovi]
MHSIQQLYDLTCSLQVLLEEGLPEGEQRLRYIRKINDILYRRDQLLKDIPAEMTVEQKDLLKKIVDLNESLKPLFVRYHKIVEHDLKKFKKSQKTAKRYQNPYENPLIDGIYLDKKR